MAFTDLSIARLVLRNTMQPRGLQVVPLMHGNGRPSQKKPPANGCTTRRACCSRVWEEQAIS